MISFSSVFSFLKWKRTICIAINGHFCLKSCLENPELFTHLMNDKCCKCKTSSRRWLLWSLIIAVKLTDSHTKDDIKLNNNARKKIMCSFDVKTIARSNIYPRASTTTGWLLRVIYSQNYDVTRKCHPTCIIYYIVNPKLNQVVRTVPTTKQSRWTQCSIILLTTVYERQFNITAVHTTLQLKVRQTFLMHEKIYNSPDCNLFLAISLFWPFSIKVSKINWNKRVAKLTDAYRFL